MSPHKVSRIYDAEKLNARINLPEILPHVAPGYQTYDLSQFINDRKNVVLQHCDSMAIFQFLDAGVYQGHFLNPAYYRGRKALESSKNIISTLFTRHGADVIYGRISRNHRAARLMARALGFKNIGERQDTDGHVCVEYMLERKEWVEF